MSKSTILSDDAVHIMRQCAFEGLGFNCTFVDDDMKVLVGLAQRAVLAGLASDCTEDMQRRFTEAAEKHRAGHERALGHAIKPAEQRIAELARWKTIVADYAVDCLDTADEKEQMQSAFGVIGFMVTLRERATAAEARIAKLGNALEDEWHHRDFGYGASRCRRCDAVADSWREMSHAASCPLSDLTPPEPQP